MEIDQSQHVLEKTTEVCHLDCVTAFDGLSKQEKLYAYYLARASWYGGLIVLHQTSPEAPSIFCLLMKIFSKQNAESVSKMTSEKCGFSEDDLTAFNVYAAGFLANMGNYKGFGDTKFIPEISQEQFMKLVMSSEAYAEDPQTVEKLMQDCSQQSYSLTLEDRQLGLKGEGLTTYFTRNCDKADAELVQRFLDAKSISAYNTRLFKTECAEGGKVKYEVRLASLLSTDDKKDTLPYLGEHEFEGHTFTVTRGDYSTLMGKVVENLEKAKENALNENEKSMLSEYIRSFTSGDLEAHKDGSRFWIKDKGPIVESYIGFIESYRDPFGTRGEFEGFVAVVNKEMSAKFSNLVTSSDTLLKRLPWPESFEKDEFMRPDFTSLDVLAFAGSGIPAGINIPNYDDIRQSEGFKNVSLGNVLSAAYSVGKKVWFLSEEDMALFKDYKSKSFEVQVGLHELLGHGSGKLFSANKDGTCNFDKNTVNPLTGSKVEKWYGVGETWDSKFAELSSPYEECRAECVGLYLCLDKEALKIFGHEGKDAEEIIYVNWLNMVYAGVQGLLYYTPENQKWRQAHMQARYVILRVLMESGIVSVKHTVCADDGKPDALITLDRSQIETKGKEAIENFLCKLQVYKSLGDIETARKMWEGYSKVSSDIEPDMIKLRQTVVLRRQPRKMFVQDNTFLKGDDVALTSYPATHGGLIDSFADRFRDEDVLQLVLS